MVTKMQRALAIAPLWLGLGGGVLSTNAAWAGADDGGSKAFFDVPGPGASDLGLQTAAPRTDVAPVTTPRRTRTNVGATATVDDNAYEGYRTVSKHKARHHVTLPRAN